MQKLTWCEQCDDFHINGGLPPGKTHNKKEQNLSQDNKQDASPEKSTPCWCCDGATERPNVMRVVSRGERKGDTVGPLCDDCERFMEQHVLIEDLPK